MLVRAAGQGANRSPRSQQEHRLLDQLQRIDHRLKGKTDFRDPNPHPPMWQIPTEEDNSGSGEWGNGRAELGLPVGGGYSEYFSQIGNQDMDEDSLFQEQNHFLGHNKPAPRTNCPLSASPCPQPSKKQETQSGDDGMGRSKITPPALQIHSQAQILKERNYVYKKQSGERSPTPTKQALPPRNGKVVGEKQPFCGGKSKERLGEGRGNGGLARWQGRSRPSQQKYICKANPIQQQIEVQASQQVKLCMFETFLSRTMEQAGREVPQQKPKQRRDQPDSTSMECTFKPTILKKSSQMAKSTKNVVQRLSTAGQSRQLKRPYQPQSNKPVASRNRIQELSQPRKLKTQGPEMVEETPSFRPSLSKKSLQQMSNCVYDVATRNKLWLEQREEKIKWLREEEERERQRKQNCTYAPALCVYKGDNNPQFSRFGKEGMASYFERVSTVGKGRARLEESVLNKENVPTNEQKTGFASRGGKKKNYDDAVKQLHSRIMGLKI